MHFILHWYFYCLYLLSAILSTVGQHVDNTWIQQSHLTVLMML